MKNTKYMDMRHTTNIKKPNDLDADMAREQQKYNA